MPLVKLAKIGEPDERQNFISLSLEDLHASLESISLDPDVPERVRELFDTAKNLSLHSWFVYEFHPIAELTGFLALERALKARAKQERPALANKPLRKIMDHAIAHGWISEDGFENRQGLARARVLDRKIRESIDRLNVSETESKPVDEPTAKEIAREATDMRIVESICNAAINIRNSLAHGEVPIAPNSHQRLRMTANLIDQLFAPTFETGDRDDSS